MPTFPPSSSSTRASRRLRSLLLIVLGAPLACANLIGLDDFSNSADADADGSASSGGVGEPGGSGGVSTGGRAPVPGTGGNANAGGDTASGGGTVKPGGTGGSDGSGGDDTSGCKSPEECADDDWCTVDSCVDGACKNEPLAAGQGCPGGVCNGIAGAEQCVRCLDSAPGDAQDVGCTPGAPQCRTAGIPTCIGCSAHGDCDDGNDCTVDTCTLENVCSHAATTRGTACDGGVCNGAQETEECVACVDTAAADGRDAGCSLARPVCDEATRTCNECSSAAHCDDHIACTEDACTQGTCTTIPKDSLCSAATGACAYNQCRAGVGCEVIEVNPDPVVLMDRSTANGSLEDVLAADRAAGWPASGWIERAKDHQQPEVPTQVSIACDNVGCEGQGGLFGAQHGTRVAWLGGVVRWTDTLTRTFTVPSNAASLRVVAHTNFQTSETGNTAFDTYEVLLVNEQNGTLASLAHGSNLNAQKSGATWTVDGVDTTVAVEPAWRGTNVSLLVKSTNDKSNISDFVFDEFRIIARVGCDAPAAD